MADEAGIKVPIRPDGLQLEEHRTFQRWFWTTERVGWIGFALLIGLALAGLTGRGGWFAVGEARAGTAAMQFPRVARRGEAVTIQLVIPGNERRHLVVLGADVLDGLELERVSPFPYRATASGSGLALEIASTGRPPHQARLHLRAAKAGGMNLEIGVDGVFLSDRLLVLP